MNAWRPRARKFLRGLPCVLLLGCANSSDPDSGELRDTTPPLITGFTGTVDTLRCATLNMSVGFPVSHLMAKKMYLDSIAYPELRWLDSLFIRGRPSERIGAMARAIAAESLDVVGLQEVMEYSLNGGPYIRFLPDLLDSLSSYTGWVYQPYFQKLNDSLLDAKWNGDSISIHFSEGNALLVRQGIAVVDTENVWFQNLLHIPMTGSKPTERGYLRAQIQTAAGAKAEAYVTHLEVIPAFSLNQSRELKLRILNGKLPNHAQIVLGDLNAVPDSGAYNVVVKDGGFHDPFRALPPAGHATCCISGSELWNPAAYFSNVRIDYVLAKALIGTTILRINLDSPFRNSADSLQFASDHRMVIAGLVLPVYP